ncbi:MAG TPA: hypothetical protein VGD34_10260 [Kribbella sp.]
MLRRLGMTLATTGAAVAMAAAAVPSTAFAWGGGGAGGGDQNVGTKGQNITVTVTGTGVKPGGGKVTVPASTVSVPPPCWMEPGMTGKQYNDFVRGTGDYSGRGLNYLNKHMGENEKPQPGQADHATDDKGQWWSATCDSGNFPGSIQDFFAFSDKFFAANPTRFIPFNQPKPVPPVPPEFLREIAIKQLKIPDPKINWNPKRTGDASTLVNIDTWFWLDNSPESMSVTATAGNNSATVQADLVGLQVSGPGLPTTTCTGAGVPYAQGATGACTAAFRSSSDGLPGRVTPVTVQTTWTATWSANGTPRGPIAQPPAPASGTTNIAVREVQSVTR